MANKDTPHGFRPIGNLYGAPYTGGLLKVAFEDEDATAVFIGDPVRLEGSADTDGNPTVERFEDEHTNCFGVVVAFEPDRTDLELKYRLASTARNAYVVPTTGGQLFAIQDNAAATPDAGWVGNTIDINAGSGNTTNGLSEIELDGATIGSGLNCHIMGLLQAADNEFGDNAEWIVRINEHSFGGDGTGS